MTESNDGWIEWNGGDRPVPGDTPVVIKFRCGKINSDATASFWWWGRWGRDDEHEIVAYRVQQANATDLIARFPRGVHLEITVVFPGEYRIGYRYQNVHYLPGTPSYYPLEDALQKCLDAFRERFPV